MSLFPLGLESQSRLVPTSMGLLWPLAHLLTVAKAYLYALIANKWETHKCFERVLLYKEEQSCSS